MRYQFKVSAGDQIKQPYSVADDYRSRLFGLVELYGFGVTRGDCELRLTPTHETFDLVRAAAKRALRQNFPGYTPAQIEARLH